MLRSTRVFLIGLSAVGLTLGSFGCASEDGDGPDEDALASGKADGSDYSPCELDAVLALVNALPIAGLEDEPAAREQLRSLGVHGSAAKCTVWYRLGLDTTISCPAEFPEGTVVEPRPFDSIERLDQVKYVGPAAFRALVTAVEDECSEASAASADVVFSPTAVYAAGHAARIASLIDSANRSVDIAMYSFSESGLKSAVLRNADRLRIRLLYDKSHLGGSLEQSMEEAGIEVRYVGQTMHHKFAIIDGVQQETDDPTETIVVSGSANWSTGAVNLYDEATVFVSHSPEMGLRFQSEFNLLWNHSYPVEGHEEIEYFESLPIDDAAITAADVPGLDAIFTSRNFRVTSSGSLQAEKDGYDVADRWIEYIENAQESIWLLSERLRSVPVGEALLRKAAENPDLDIRVYMDNQEYISANTSNGMVQDLAQCYAAATTETQRINCEAGMYYSYLLHEEFLDNPNQALRLKYYSYNWHYSFPQNHHKSMIVDGRYVLTGSYNLSFNAEFKTFENVMIFDGQQFPALVDAYVEEFDQLWRRGEEQGAYDALMSQVNGSGAEVPIRFDAISMTWQQVDDYRSAVRAACGYNQLYNLGQQNETAYTCTRQ